MIHYSCHILIIMLYVFCTFFYFSFILKETLVPLLATLVHKIYLQPEAKNDIEMILQLT